MKWYVVYNMDYEEMGKFKTMKEARACVRDCKAFDKRNNNPFNEQYVICKEDYDDQQEGTTKLYRTR